LDLGRLQDSCRGIESVDHYNGCKLQEPLARCRRRRPNNSWQSNWR